jgi:indole-3-glycerol phosphate synthase
VSNILDIIVADKRTEVDAARHARPIEELTAACADLPRPRNFYSAVAGGDPDAPLRLIAEIKQRSPSGGELRPDLDPAAIAHIYHDAGAAAISVLTDERYFGGRLQRLQTVRDAVPLPVLRKDFIIDEYQIYESRAAGADAILLIAEILDDRQILDYLILAHELGLTVLLEVHEADSLLRVRSAIGFPHERFSLLGINNRDLKTQTVDLNTTCRLAPLVDERLPLVAESGVRTRADVLKLQQAGVRAVLVGETFMRAEDIGAKVRELFPQ